MGKQLVETKHKAGDKVKITADSSGSHHERINTTVRIEVVKDDGTLSVITDDGKHVFDVDTVDVAGRQEVV